MHQVDAKFTHEHNKGIPHSYLCYIKAKGIENKSTFLLNEIDFKDFLFHNITTFL